MSLRWKIAATMAALAGVVASVAAVGAYVTASRQTYQSIDEGLIEQARSAVSRPGGRRGPGPGGGIGNDLDVPRCPDPGALRTVRSAQVIRNGTAVACTQGATIITPTDAELALTTQGSTLAYRLRDTKVDGESVRVITMSHPAGGALQLVRDIDEPARILDRLRVRLVFIALFAIVAAALVGFALATRIVQPIRKLTTTAHHIAATGDLATVVPASGTDEIGSLAASFTTMVESLAASQEQQQRLISDASHEMRTPLTSLRTNLELLARTEQAGAGELDPVERRAVIDDLQFETGELTTLLTELVELATDRSTTLEPPEETDFVALCESIAGRAARRTGRLVEVAVAPGVPRARVVVRPTMIERAVSNLVDNAVKYSPGATPVEVIVAGTRIEVRDHGPGIAPEDLPRVFDRFYRATNARTEPGSGLGLAIVAQIVQSHGGSVFASNHPEGGAVVGFELRDARTAN